MIEVRHDDSKESAMTCTHRLALDQPYAQDVECVRAALSEQGFGIITEIVMRATVAKKLVVVLALLAVRALRRRDAGVDPAGLATLLVCTSTYMIVTGVVYNLLLRSIPIAGISDVWTNETLHLVVPLFLLADVLIGPRRRALPWRTVLVAAVLPVAWVLYTMVRANFVVGPATGDPWWYPYPFLDPHLVPGEYAGVGGYILGIAAVILGTAAGVVAVGRRRGLRDADQGVRGLSSPSTGADRSAGT